MEEDIKQLEELILDRKSFVIGDKEHDEIYLKDISAIENLIKGYRELEKENDSKEKAYNDCYCEFKHYKQYESIPKSKIKEKIDYYIGMYEIGKLHEDEASKHQMEAILSIINDLQELMEDK